MSKKIIFKGIFFSFFAFLINYLITFFLTPFITNNIGTDAYGYVTLAKTFASYALILMTALNSYSSRFITIEYHSGNYQKANSYFNSVFFANFFISLFILSLVTLNIINIQKFIHTPASLIKDVSILFILIFVNFVINTTSTAFQAAAYIKNKIDLANIFRGLSYLSEAIILFFLYNQFNPTVFFVGIGLCISSIVLLLGNIYITKKFTPELKIKFSQFKINYVKELVINGIWNSFNSLGNTLNSGLDLLVCSIFLDPVVMGQLSIAKSICSIFSGIYQMASTPFHPSFLKSYASNDIKNLKNELEFSMKISGLISNLTFAGFLSLGIIYYSLWIPNQDIKSVYILTVISILSYVLEGVMYPLYYIYTLTIKNKVPCIITILGGIINVFGMILLLKYTHLGVYAIVLTTAVIMTIINGITNPIYMAKCLKISPFFFYKNIFKHLLSCILMSFSFILITKHIMHYSWLLLIIYAIFEIFIGILLHCLVVFGIPIKKK